MDETELFLAPCSKQQSESRAYAHLQETVLSPIVRPQYSRYTEKDFGRTVRVWGATQGTKPTWKHALR